jgi:2-methylcitrate dehydratase PrpD
MKETKELTKRCHDLSYNALPEEVIDRVKYLTLDYLGVAARGSLSESSAPILNFISNRCMVREGAVVIGTDLKADPTYAALANGTFAHSIELDDVVNEASLHPAVVIMSSALASSHIAGSGGRTLIEGIVVGYEAMIRLGFSLDPKAHYAQGFHPTGTCGTMGSALTAAKILGLNQEAMTNALGIAGSQAAASMEFLSDGSFTKRLHAGWAAHSGVIAALLAREGFTGPGTIIEGRYGFLRSHSPNSDPSSLFENWGDPFKVMKTSIKPHACCRYKQGPIDGILEIMHQNSLNPSDVEEVKLGILKAGFPIVAQPEESKYNPKSIVDAQFSMPFGAAVAILHGRASLEEYTLKNIMSPEIKQMMEKIHCVEDPELERDFPEKWPASVTLSTKSGQQYHTKIEFPKGDPENPLTWDELIHKFKNLIPPVFSDGRGAEIISYVRGIELVKDLKDLSNLLSKS